MRFGDLLYEDVMDQYLDIKQNGSIKKYMDEFERLSVYLPLIEEAITMQVFMKELKAEIQAESSREKYPTLRQLANEALKAEKHFRIIRQALCKNYLKGSKPFSGTPRQNWPSSSLLSQHSQSRPHNLQGLKSHKDPEPKHQATGVSENMKSCKP